MCKSKLPSLPPPPPKKKMMCKRIKTPQIKERGGGEKEKKSTGCVRVTTQIKNWSQHGMSKTNSLRKNQDSVGCVRENPRIKIKVAWDL